MFSIYKGENPQKTALVASQPRAVVWNPPRCHLFCMLRGTFGKNLKVRLDKETNLDAMQIPCYFFFFFNSPYWLSVGLQRSLANISFRGLLWMFRSLKTGLNANLYFNGTGEGWQTHLPFVQIVFTCLYFNTQYHLLSFSANGILFFSLPTNLIMNVRIVEVTF